MACRECEGWRIATFLRKWKSQANPPRNVLLFFKRDTNTLISGKKMPGLHQAFQQTGVIAKNQNGSSHKEPKKKRISLIINKII
ncbi:hypothetical protein E3I66_10350 [Salmonella enterica]|nr:hypothetical protein [Salmonella enterica]